MGMDFVPSGFFSTTGPNVVLFGGRYKTTPLGGTFRLGLDTMQWVQLTTIGSPPPLGSSRMVYDEAINKLVLFGGERSAGSQEDRTWLFDGANREWTALPANPPNTPSARSSEGLAYDATRGQIVLFGGFVGGTNVSGQTWTFDGTSWTNRTSCGPGPSPRSSPAMAWDGQEVVLFGGRDANQTNLGDTWLWKPDPVTGELCWFQDLGSTHPSARTRHRMAYNQGTQEIVVFGGSSTAQDSPQNDTWFYTPATGWFQCGPDVPNHPCVAPDRNLPVKRCCMGLSYGDAGGRMVMFGGSVGSPSGEGTGAHFGDTWSWGSSGGWLCRIGPCVEEPS